MAEIGKDYLISIHALREEGDLPNDGDDQRDDGFLSTPSVRRATYVAPTCELGKSFLSTPSVRRATPCRCHAAHRP